MDGDPVKQGKPAQGSGAGAKPPAPKSLAELFEELCPQYMAMGMTWDEFWHRNTSCHYAYRKAWEEKKRYRNWEMWMQGGYIYDALLKVAPVMRAAFGKGRVEPGEYPKEPYPLTDKELQEREEAKRKAKFEMMLARFERESEETLKKQAEESKEQENGSTLDAQEGG